MGKNKSLLHKRKVICGIATTFFLNTMLLCSCNLTSSPDKAEDTTSQVTTLTIAVNSDVLASNGFAFDEETDTTLLDLSQVKLLTTDVDGNVVYQAASAKNSGEAAAPQGIADIDTIYDKKTGYTSCTIKLRDNLNYPGGKITADDVIFNYYVHCDESYNGNSRVAQVPIAGLDEYQCGCSNVKKFEKQVKEELANPSTKTINTLTRKVIAKQLEKEYTWVKSLYKDENYASYTTRFTKPEELFAFFYNLEDHYTTEGKKKADIISEIAAQYNGNYTKLGNVCGTDLKEESEAVVRQLIQAKQTKNKVNTITGITKKDDYTIEILYKGKSKKNIEKLCDIYLLPLSLYGNKESYNYEEAAFGFTKGKADKLCAQKITTYTGAGAYSFQDTTDCRYNFTANADFYQGEALCGNLTILQLKLTDMTSVVESEAADIAVCEYTRDIYKNVKKINQNEEKIQLFTQPKSGYVYLGADFSSVENAVSPEAKSLRAHILSVCGEHLPSSLNAYFGDTVSSLAEDSLSLLSSADILEASDYSMLPDTFNLSIVGFGKKDHPAFEMAENASRQLEEDGITLNIIDEPDVATLWKHVNEHSSQFWIYNYSSPDGREENPHYQYATKENIPAEEAATELPLFQKQTALIVSETVTLPQPEDSYSDSYSYVRDISRIHKTS